MNQEAMPIPEKQSNSLIMHIESAAGRVERLKSEVREFYYRVVLIQFHCPVCSATLRMIGPSKSTCPNGHLVDPTVQFQRSQCCDASLIKKICHYACAKCGKITSSRFLFDERVFDSQYFAEMMQESRERRRDRIAEITELLMNSRSGW